MRLQSEGMPNSHNGVLGKAGLPDHQASAPVGPMGGHRFQCPGNDFLDLLVTDFTRRAYPRLIRQAIEPELSKAFPPFPDGRTGDVQLAGNLRIAHSLLATEHD